MHLERTNVMLKISTLSAFCQCILSKPQASSVSEACDGKCCRNCYITKVRDLRTAGTIAQTFKYVAHQQFVPLPPQSDYHLNAYGEAGPAAVAFSIIS